MAEQKKKTVHPPLKRKRQIPSREFAEMEKLLNLRLGSTPTGKIAKTKRTYHAETLGLPPLKMVLVHAQNERANEVAKQTAKSRRKRELTQEEAVMKIIEHLTKS
jgi:hypothetical protein